MVKNSHAPQAVLELGGHLEAKDRSGATPLFLACETGKLACACALMAAGAELQTRNSAGEAPLYIAALKGHERIVEELLGEFQLRSQRWTVGNLFRFPFQEQKRLGGTSEEGTPVAAMSFGK